MSGKCPRATYTTKELQIRYQIPEIATEILEVCVCAIFTQCTLILLLELPRDIVIELTVNYITRVARNHTSRTFIYIFKLLLPTFKSHTSTIPKWVAAECQQTVM